MTSKKIIDDMPVSFHAFLPSIQGTAAWRNRAASKPSGNWERSISSPSPLFLMISSRLMQGKTYKKNCTVARSELRYLRCLHVDKDGRDIVGEMVVNKAIAADVLDILQKALRGEISDRTDEAHRLLGCQ